MTILNRKPFARHDEILTLAAAGPAGPAGKPGRRRAEADPGPTPADDGPDSPAAFRRAVAGLVRARAKVNAFCNLPSAEKTDKGHARMEADLSDEFRHAHFIELELDSRGLAGARVGDFVVVNLFACCNDNMNFPEGDPDRILVMRAGQLGTIE